ncbi:type I polyketide synthase, partial [Streptomyces sp. NPDC005963]|uniref:type I polyketide synthase n=1 Tax=Streptomyces sp. NPDC005963 TaxID=3156721 RepID=UPI0033ED622D
MHHRTLPRTLHIDQPSPHIDWTAGNVQLLTEAREWKDRNGTLRAAVSSFGISGTNAHIILEHTPQPTATEDSTGTESDAAPVAPDEEPQPWLLSAHTPEALRAQADRLHHHLESLPDDTSSAAVAHALATRRGALDHRVSFAAAGRDEALSALRQLADEGPLGARETSPQLPRLAFLFSGQGSQRAGMGRELHHRHPVFARAFDAACAALDPHLGRSLSEIVFGDDGELLDRTAYTQPALFALQTALYRLMESVGVTPDRVAGHSIGSITAAHVAGVLSLADAATLISARGRLMQALPAGGAMVALSLDEPTTAALIAGHESVASIAAVNGPRSTVVSGAEEAIADITARAVEQGAKTRRLTVSHAFHSPLMEPVLAEFRTVLAGLEFHAPNLPVVSDLTGGVATAEELSSPDYWTRHLRETVRFADALRTLETAGSTVYLELGPDAVLSTMAVDTLPTAPLFTLLRRDRPEGTTVAGALGELWATGVEVNWTQWFAAADPAVRDLPTYPFQRERYWLDARAADKGDVTTAGLDTADHPLLGAAVELADGSGTVHTGRMSLRTHPWLADHALSGAVVVPGSALLDLALYAGEAIGAPTVEELTLRSPLVIPPDGAVQLQLTVGADDGEGHRPITIHARPADADEPWAEHASGALGNTVTPVEPVSAEWPPSGAESVPVASAYEDLERLGYSYGPAFRGLRAAWRRGDVRYAEISADAGQPDPAGPGHIIHPAVLDSVLHPLALEALEEPAGLRVPFVWVGVRAFGGSTTSPLRVRLTPVGNDRTHILVTDQHNTPVLSVDGLVLRAVDPARLAAGTGGGRLHQVRWTPLSGSVATAGWVEYEEASGSSDVPHLVWRAPERPDPHRTAELLRGWLDDERSGAARLVVVTQGALAVRAGEAVAGLDQSSLWGLVRTAQSEHPGRFVLIDTDDTPASQQALSQALATNEPQLALRNGTPHTPRLTPLTHTTHPQPTLNPHGTVLITGATGALGTLIAEHL